MIKQRIIATLKFFDLQDTPLTLFELHKFLLTDLELIQKYLDENWELKEVPELPQKNEKISIDAVLTCLQKECQGEVVEQFGFYALYGRGALIKRRLEDYSYGIRREKLIKKYISGAKAMPFLRGIGLVGSQALGHQKQSSDIDLLILVAPNFMWLARVFVTAYFQVLGKRRHGKKVVNRFCLNHYIVSGRELMSDRNLYTAAEYLKLRPLVYSGNLGFFQKQNRQWIGFIFPNASFTSSQVSKQSGIQSFLEKLLDGSFGLWLEQAIKKIQYRSLNLGEFIVATDQELSFHPHNRKKDLFQRFFKSH